MASTAVKTVRDRRRRQPLLGPGCRRHGHRPRPGPGRLGQHLGDGDDQRRGPGGGQRVARSGAPRTIEITQGPVRLRSPSSTLAVPELTAGWPTDDLVPHHYLFDMPRHPRFAAASGSPGSTTGASAAFAAAGNGPTTRAVFVRTTTGPGPGDLRQRRPDLRVAHFSHCPWADPGYFQMLPGRAAGRSWKDARGRPARVPGPRWARNFLRCCLAAGFGVDFERHTVRAGDGRTCRTPYPGVDDALGNGPLADVRPRPGRGQQPGDRLIVRSTAWSCQNILRGRGLACSWSATRGPGGGSSTTR